jgi:hypothetical protein
MPLSLDALANWEAAVLARIAGATGTPDERDAQITRSGLYAEYPAIIRAYGEVSGPERETSLEVTKRTLFLIWHSFKALPVDSGISEVAESTVREVFARLEATIAGGRADDELRWMLAWYRDTFPEPFDTFGPVRSLDAFIRDVSTEDALDGLRASSFTGRGQLGMYWSSLLGS